VGSPSFTDPTDLDATGVFTQWTIRRTCGALDSGRGIFLNYQLTFRGQPVPVNFRPEYEDLTMDDLPHLIAVIDKIIPEVLGNQFALRTRECFDMQSIKAITDALDESG